MTTTPEHLDDLTTRLIYALRGSLTEITPLDFWQGRVTTALEAAAAGASTGGQAVTIAARKLQIETLRPGSAEAAVECARQIDETGYEEWAGHIHESIVYVVALAYATRKTARKPKAASTPPAEPTGLTTEPIPF